MSPLRARAIPELSVQAGRFLADCPGPRARDGDRPDRRHRRPVRSDRRRCPVAGSARPRDRATTLDPRRRPFRCRADQPLAERARARRADLQRPRTRVRQPRSDAGPTGGGGRGDADHGSRRSRRRRRVDRCRRGAADRRRRSDLEPGHRPRAALLAAAVPRAGGAAAVSDPRSVAGDLVGAAPAGAVVQPARGGAAGAGAGARLSGVRARPAPAAAVGERCPWVGARALPDARPWRGPPPTTGA